MLAATEFQFLDVPRLFALVDHELELVEPQTRYVDELLAACHHPLTQDLMPQHAKTEREHIESFLAQNPRGHSAADPSRQIAPGYTFWMRVRVGAQALPSRAGKPLTVMAGSISLRLGHGVNLDRYLGHIGYHVLPPARGHHFAERACRLILPLARAHGHTHLWITCNPDNLASRRSIERLGAVYTDTVPVPKENSLYSQGDRHKCRYRLDL
ncbi:MAG TPA: GNAT family N-acetyltransferase [Phycisphaerae bacterium]|jgi:tagatose 1,6-diphosphate aldolase|nr:GNAT family N-acetyltransferase [Phycisphaerae bacterium]